MASQAEKRELRSPVKRTAGDGYFFPNEAVRILRLERVDYYQLRRLFKLVRDAAGEIYRERKWARFSLQDLAALRVAIELAGGHAALAKGRRLQLKPIDDACRALRKNFKLRSPLTQARLYRQGRTVVAELGGVHFVPQTGQLVMGTLGADARRHVVMHDSPKVVGAILEQLDEDEKRLRGVRLKRAAKCRESSGRAAKPLVEVA